MKCGDLLYEWAGIRHSFHCKLDSVHVYGLYSQHYDGESWLPAGLVIEPEDEENE